MSKILGIPLILIFVVLAIVVPVTAMQVVIVREEMRIQAKLDKVLSAQIQEAIAENKANVTPTLVLSPIPTVKAVVKPATTSGVSR